MCIVTDAKGNQLSEYITGDEAQLIANAEYRPLTSALVIVKGPAGFMLLMNRYRNEWELPGGMIEVGETPRETAVRECREESGYDITNLRFLGLLKFFLQPSWHIPLERTEYTALYCTYIATELSFRENEEMLALHWHRIGEGIRNASLIDLKLLEFYR